MSNQDDFNNTAQLAFDTELDATGLACPEPLMLLRNKVREMVSGDVIKVIATDPTTERDFIHFCEFMNHEYLAADHADFQEGAGHLSFWIRKG